MSKAKIDTNTLVLLSAAAAAALGVKRVRVERIRLIQRISTTWKDHGRSAIQMSHLIGKHSA